MSGFRSHRLLQLLVDAGIVALSWFLAFELRFDQGLPIYYDTLLRRTIPATSITCSSAVRRSATAFGPR